MCVSVSVSACVCVYITQVLTHKWNVDAQIRFFPLPLQLNSSQHSDNLVFERTNVPGKNYIPPLSKLHKNNLKIKYFI